MRGFSLSAQRQRERIVHETSHTLNPSEDINDASHPLNQTSSPAQASRCACNGKAEKRRRTRGESSADNAASVRAARRSPSLVEGLLNIGVDVFFADSEGPADTDCRKVSTVDKAVHRHLGHTHDRGNFRDRQELNVGDPIGFSRQVHRHSAPTFLCHALRLPHRRPRVHADGRIEPGVTRGEEVNKDIFPTPACRVDSGLRDRP